MILQSERVVTLVVDGSQIHAERVRECEYAGIVVDRRKICTDFQVRTQGRNRVEAAAVYLGRKAPRELMTEVATDGRRSGRVEELEVFAPLAVKFLPKWAKVLAMAAPNAEASILVVEVPCLRWDELAECWVLTSVQIDYGAPYPKGVYFGLVVKDIPAPR